MKYFIRTAPSCLWHASVSKMYVRSDLGGEITGGLSRASLNVCNELIYASLMLGNVSPKMYLNCVTFLGLAIACMALHIFEVTFRQLRPIM